MADSVRWIGRALVKGGGFWLLRQGISGLLLGCNAGWSG
jgi:hypothetical protein